MEDSETTLEAGRIDPHELPQEITFPLKIAGFWRRILADLIDVTLMGVILLVPTLLFFQPFFYARGPYGRQYGFIFGVAYLTLFNSRLGNGQTPGKRFLSLKVTDQNADLLSVRRAFVRSMFLLTIYLLNGWKIPVFTTSPLLFSFAGTLIYGGILALLYSYIFNRTTQQGPHDLLVGSYVVHVPHSPVTRYSAPSCPPIHSRIVAGLFALMLLFSVGMFFVSSTVGPNAHLRDLYRELNEDSRFFEISVGRSGESLTVSAWYSEDCRGRKCQALFDELASTTVEKYEAIEEIKILYIRIYRATDLGFASTSNIITVWYDVHPEG